MFCALALLACACAPSRGTTPPPPRPLESDGGSDGAAPEISVLDLPEADVEPPQRPHEACVAQGELHVFTSPRAPLAGDPVHAFVVSDAPFDGELTLRGRGTTATSDTRLGGPPFHLHAVLPSAPTGALEVELRQLGCGEAKPLRRKLYVARGPAPPPLPAVESRVWDVRNRWNHRLENLYSAWIEAMFDAPPGTDLTYRALHEILRDRSRNGLFDYLGQSEDSAGDGAIRPDCADLPYFLRAYFAFKLGLPFGVSQCNRGGAGKGPTCDAFFTIESQEVQAQPTPDSLAKSFGEFMRGPIANKAHSGSGRTAFDDDESDYYPVRVDDAGLRPGTVFADPYGHVLVLAHRVPQSAKSAGILFAIDGQPDGTIARKRFWRGNFLYDKSPALGGPGWKRFRPLFRKEDQYVRATNDELAADPQYKDVSLEASAWDRETFYDRMELLLSPSPLDPQRALVDAIDAFDEQVRARVRAVENGRAWLAKGGAVTMPEGTDIFETTGPWEDFSTPSRDLRLLIALDSVVAFPARVEARPERYAMPRGVTPSAVRAALQGRLQRELAQRRVRYARSDGSSFELSLRDVVARARRFEVAFHPVDCPEIRWGAEPGSQEAATCASRAPDGDRARMDEVRPWFSTRTRPPRK